MFLAITLEDVTQKTNAYNIEIRGTRVLVWRVELNSNGRPVWMTHRQGGTWWNYSGTRDAMARSRKSARASQSRHVPTVAGAAHGKLVTLAEAAKLVDVLPPASLDRLTEIVSEGHSYDLQNYVKPKPVKEPKPEPASKSPPTRAEIAQAKLNRARAKATEWQVRAKHASDKAKEWEREARRLERRTRQLIAAIE